MDYKVLLAVVVFLGSFAFIQTVFNTEFVSYSYESNYTAIWNGTVYSNATAGAISQGAIPTPPECNWGFAIIDGVTSCVGGYVGYYWDMATFRSDVAWLNILFIIPMMVVLTLFIIKILIELGKIFADMIPFT